MANIPPDDFPPFPPLSTSMYDAPPQYSYTPPRNQNHYYQLPNSNPNPNSPHLTSPPLDPHPHPQSRTLAPIIPLLLPNLHTLHHHLPIVLPRRRPLIPCQPKLLLRRRRRIHPRLPRRPVLKPPIRAPNRHIQNQIKVLIKRRLQIPRLAPRIHQARPVRAREREIPPLPQRLVKGGVQHLQQPGVDVGEDVLFAPLHPERVHRLGEGGVERVPLHVRPPPRVVGRVGPPVQGTRDDVVAALGVGVVVPPRFRNVDLARARPRSVRVLDRQQPNAGPEPIALRQRSDDLDPTVLDRRPLLRVDPARFGRVDDGPVRQIGGNDAVGPQIGRATALP